MSLRGAITKWMGDKGYGFVRVDGGYQDIFLHLSAIEGGGEPGVGKSVRFDVDSQTGKPRAIKVRIGDGMGGGGGGGGMNVMSMGMGGLGGLQSMLSGSLQVQGSGSFGAGDQGGYDQRGGYQNKRGQGHQRNRDRDQYGKGQGQGQRREGGRKQQWQEEKPLDEEEVLIEFGKLLQSGNEEAKKVHESYEEKKDMKDFMNAAAKLLSKKGGKSEKAEKPVREPKPSSSKNEETVLIAFGAKLNDKDEAAVALHKQHQDGEIDFAEFVKKAGELVEDN